MCCVASVARRDGGYVFTTESAWQRAAVDVGAVVHGVERHGVPVLDGGPPLPAIAYGSSAFGRPPALVHWGGPSEVQRSLGERVAASYRKGHGCNTDRGHRHGCARCADAPRPHRHRHGDRRGRRSRSSGTPSARVLATYVAGTEALYDWAPGRVVVERIEHTHDPRRLAEDPPLIAVNTALEIDVHGQVNVESVEGSAVAGIGGHPDYAFAAAPARGAGLA